MRRPKTPTLLNVHGEADGRSTFLGQVSYDARRQSSAFQWSEDAVGLGLEWSPLRLPLSPAPWFSSLREADLMGLPGLVHDALPDGWGMLLMDRAFGQAGIPPEAVSPLLRLSFLGDRCWGALRFDPEWGDDIPKVRRVALDALAQEAQAVVEGDTQRVSDALLVAGGSPHGARPKIMVAVNDDASRALVGQETLPAGFRHVLIKFAGDGEDPTHPALEFFYGEAARSLGILTSPARLIHAGPRLGLCLDRFDRIQGQKRHVHSMAGMLHTTHRIANADWTTVSDLLKNLPGGERDLEEAFRRAVFNAVFCVRDDHTKNIAFLRNPDGTWGLSPAFDLAYSDGPGGYHTMAYHRHRGPHVSLHDLRGLAAFFQVPADRVDPLVRQAQGLRESMVTAARDWGVSKRILSGIAKRFRDIDKGLKPVSPVAASRKRLNP